MGQAVFSGPCATNASHSVVSAVSLPGHCGACDRDLCSSRYDKYKAGDGSIHPLEHAGSLQIVAPIVNSWGGNGLGVPPAPPAYNPRRRRGPWG